MAKGPWRCSQCGTVNEPGARACSNCGKWPSLFDLQDPVDEVEPEVTRGEIFEAETFEPEIFHPDPQEVADEEVAEGEEQRSRFPRWIVSVIWIAGILIWIVVNAFADSG
jgi:hypothetical protein